MSIDLQENLTIMVHLINHIISKKVYNTSEHPRHPDTNVKLNAIKRCFSYGEGVEYVSKENGYSLPVYINGTVNISNLGLHDLYQIKSK